MGKISTKKMKLYGSSLSGIRIEQSADGRVLVTIHQDTAEYHAVAALPELQDSLTCYGIYGHKGGGIVIFGNSYITVFFDTAIFNHSGGCIFFLQNMREYAELESWLRKVTARWLRAQIMRP